MLYSTFNQDSTVNALQENMFLGAPVAVSRYDQQKHGVFEKLIEKQHSFFWRPEEVDTSRDRGDWQKLSAGEQHIFISNLKYQILLDSVTARGVNVTFLPLVSIPELETWIETWGFSETIHSRSYTHILRNLFTEPQKVFEDIIINDNIIKRAESLTKYYDDLIEYSQMYNLCNGQEGTHSILGREVTISLRELKKKMFLSMFATNGLEAIRFYVSFACSWAFAERELMEGNAKIIKLIARDEQLHLNGTQHIINLWRKGADDPEMMSIFEECKDEAMEMFKQIVREEKEWAEYLFKDGSMIGLNKKILWQYIEYISNERLKAIGLDAVYETTSNPIPWINSYLNSDAVQVAPQETEISSYLVGQIDSNVSIDDFEDFDL